MSIFQKVTLATLAKNKVRTAVTLIGVLLATAMICAVEGSEDSVLTYSPPEVITASLCRSIYRSYRSPSAVRFSSMD